MTLKVDLQDDYNKTNQKDKLAIGPTLLNPSHELVVPILQEAQHGMRSPPTETSKEDLGEKRNARIMNRNEGTSSPHQAIDPGEVIEA